MDIKKDPNYKEFFSILEKHNALLHIGSTCGNLTLVYVQMSPDLAKDLLTLEVDYNRSRRTKRNQFDSVVKKIIESIKNGKWQPEVDFIRVNVKGEIFDGGHRLESFLNCGECVYCYFSLGHPKENFDQVDQDRKLRRTPDTLLHVLLRLNPKAFSEIKKRISDFSTIEFSSAMSNYWRWENGFLSGRNQSSLITPEGKEDLITDENKLNLLLEGFSVCNTPRMRVCMPIGWAVCLYTCMRMINNKRGITFLKGLAGETNDLDIEKTRAHLVQLNGKTSPIIRIARPIQALNQYIANKEIVDGCMNWTPKIKISDPESLFDKFQKKPFPKLEGFKYTKDNIPIIPRVIMVDEESQNEKSEAVNE